MIEVQQREALRLLMVLDPNGHVDELRRRLRRELRSVESVLFVQPSAFETGRHAALTVAIDLLEHCHRHQRRWYDQQDLLMVLGGLEEAYRAHYRQEQTKSPWLRGYMRIWQRVLAILERLPVVEDEQSSQSEN